MNTPNIAEALHTIEHWLDRIEVYADDSYTRKDTIIDKLKEVKRLITADLYKFHAASNAHDYAIEEDYD